MEPDFEQERQQAFERYQAGESVSAIAASLHRSPWWVRKWLTRADPDDPTWFRDRSRRPHRSPRQCTPAVEALVLAMRGQLQREGAFHGAQAILWELEALQTPEVPTARTIARILARHGAVAPDAEPYQPKGKKYPAPDGTAVGSVQQMDFVGPRYGKPPLRFYSLNTVELATGRCAVEPALQRDAQATINAIWATWGRLGVPRYGQVDNELVFFGSRRHPRGMGPLIRLCLPQGVEPLFIPIAEPWRNGVVEKFNDLYEHRFRRRVPLEDAGALSRESRRFEEHHNARYRYSKLHGRTPLAVLRASGALLRFPDTASPPRHPLPKPERGRYHFMRFIRSDRVLDIFGERFPVPVAAVYEYVRATVDVSEQRLLVYLDGQLIDTHDYRLR